MIIQKRRSADRLHGVKLEMMLNVLVAHFGWTELSRRINIRCFTSDPSITSSLTFLRKTPWAREKVEGLYLFALREAVRAAKRQLVGDVTAPQADKS